MLKDHIAVREGMIVEGSFSVIRHPTWLRHFEVDIEFEVEELGLKYSQKFPLWR